MDSKQLECARDIGHRERNDEQQARPDGGPTRTSAPRTARSRPVELAREPGFDLSGLSNTYRLRPDVRFRIVGGEAVVLRQDEAEVLVLNGVGSEMLRLLAEGLELDEIEECLLEMFEVEREELGRDLTEFLERLESVGVLQRPDGQATGEVGP